MIIQPVALGVTGVTRVIFRPGGPTALAGAIEEADSPVPCPVGDL